MSRTVRYGGREVRLVGPRTNSAALATLIGVVVILTILAAYFGPVTGLFWYALGGVLLGILIELVMRDPAWRWPMYGMWGMLISAFVAFATFRVIGRVLTVF